MNKMIFYCPGYSHTTFILLFQPSYLEAQQQPFTLHNLGRFLFFMYKKTESSLRYKIELTSCIRIPNDHIRELCFRTPDVAYGDECIASVRLSKACGGPQPRPRRCKLETAPKPPDPSPSA